jgi:tetratricopeptide (TPR) repeat protein
MAFVSVGRLDYAAQTYLKAREKTRNRQLYFNELVGLYQQMGNYAAMTNEYFDLLDNYPSMMNSIQISMQRALQEAPDERLADGVRQALVSRVQEHPENKTYLEMMIWFALQQKDFRFALEQAEAIDARFPDLGGAQLLRVARIAQNNDDLAVAADAYHHLVAKGKDNPYYFDARVGELEVEFAQINHNYTVDSKSLATLQAKYLAAFGELGKNERTIPLMRNYAALMAYHGGDAQAAVDILDDALEIPRLKPQIKDEIKLELGDLLLFAGQTWDASLLYMQVEKANKDDVLGAMGKYRNARLSYYNHDFEWAKSQLDVLRASTSKLIANDAMELSLLISDNMEDDSTYSMLELFADADLLFYRNMLDSALSGFDAVSSHTMSHPLLDEVLMRKAQIKMKQGRYQEADSLLQRLVNFYPYDITADDALMLMAELNEERLDNRDKALQCYEKILIDYPTSLYADRARKRYNNLKAR